MANKHGRLERKARHLRKMAFADRLTAFAPWLDAVAWFGPAPRECLIYPARVFVLFLAQVVSADGSCLQTLHDLGKVGVKDNVLNKNGPPTAEDWEMIKRHPILGCDVLGPVRLLTREHLNLVRGHHERMDGTGYPDGLQGDQIPMATRVIIVADAYDAMASDRAYRPALFPEKIIEQLRQFSSSQFDPKVANVFIDLIQKGDVPQKTGPSE